jgi:hypothetical protein
MKWIKLQILAKLFLIYCKTLHNFLFYYKLKGVQRPLIFYFVNINPR